MLLGVSHAGEFPLYERLEEITGVQVTFVHPPFGQSPQQHLELIKNAASMPDIIEWNWSEHYPGGPQQAINDGLIVPLNDLIQQHASNLWRVVTENEEVGRWITTDEGSYYVFPFLRLDPQLRVPVAPFFKADWLDAVGLAPPETLDEWHNVLTAFKSYDFETMGQSEEYPLLIFCYVPWLEDYIEMPFFMESNVFASAFGVSHGFYSAKTGIEYGPIQPEYREMLKMLSEWYAQGLIHPSLSQPERYDDFVEAIVKTGAWIGSFWLSGYVSPFRLVAAPLPKGNMSGSLPLGYSIDPVYDGSRSAAISSQSEHQVEAVRWLDVAYTDMGSMIFNYGIEGETYEVTRKVATLLPETLKDLQNNYNGGSEWRSKILQFARAYSGGPYVLSESFMTQYREATGLSASTMSARLGEGAQNSPEAILRLYPENRQSFDQIMFEVEQHHFRSFIAFVTGQRPIEEFDDFVKKALALGIPRARNILNEAWQRFQSKNRF